MLNLRCRERLSNTLSMHCLIMEYNQPVELSSIKTKQKTHHETITYGVKFCWLQKGIMKTFLLIPRIIYHWCNSLLLVYCSQETWKIRITSDYMDKWMTDRHMCAFWTRFQPVILASIWRVNLKLEESFHIFVCKKITEFDIGHHVSTGGYLFDT